MLYQPNFPFCVVSHYQDVNGVLILITIGKISVKEKQHLLFSRAVDEPVWSEHIEKGNLLDSLRLLDTQSHF